MKTVVLLSGGIDSATTLYYAKSKGYDTFCLTFDYGQRHEKEIGYALRIAKASGSRRTLLKIDLPWHGSSLIDSDIKLPKARIARKGIPSTYVPGRNIIFLSYAVSYAEVIGARKIFIGANQLDYSGYPDCRGSFIRQFNEVVNKGTKQGVEGKGIRIEAPLLDKNKKDIIKMAVRLKVPLKYTWSCYRGGKRPCGACDSCLIRAKGFAAAGIKDPLLK